MAKRRQFEIGYYYHSYSRGVYKDLIFIDDLDYKKFMYLLDDSNCKETKEQIKILKNKTKLVDIFCFTLMPNHFHILIKELNDGGISKFIQKVLSRYTTYFNKKYKRQGTLFESRFKDKFVDSDQYFEHLVGYIWNNPIKLIRPDYNSKDLLNGSIILTEDEKKYAADYPYKSSELEL